MASLWHDGFWMIVACETLDLFAWNQYAFTDTTRMQLALREEVIKCSLTY